MAAGGARASARFPDEWFRLGELFESVRLDIPLHFSMRHVVRRYEYTMRRRNKPFKEGDAFVDGDKAAWLHFTATLQRWGVERVGEAREWRYHDLIPVGQCR